MDQRDMDAVSAMVADFSSHLNNLEEKMQLLRERVSILSQTLLKQNDRLNNELSDIKSDLNKIKDNHEKLKETIDHVAFESSTFARKEEILSAQRFMKLFEPLNFVNEEDVKKIVLQMIKQKDIEE